MAEPTPSPIVRRRIGRRLALGAGGACALLLAVLVPVLVVIEGEAVERAAADQVGLLAESAATAFAVVDERHRTHRAAPIIEQVGRAQHVSYVDVLDHAGRVTKSSLSSRQGHQDQLPAALRDVTIDDELLTVTYSMPWTRECIGCHKAENDPVGAVRVAVSREFALSSLERFHLFGGLGILGVLAVLVGLILVITDRLVSRPLFTLARLMAQAEQGDFLVRARQDRDDEVGALGRAFNSMLKNITALKATEIEREADLMRAHEELELKRQLEEVAEKLQSSNAELERKVAAQDLLMEAAHRLGSTLEAESQLERLADVVRDKMRLSDFAILLVEADAGTEPVLRLARASGRASLAEVMRESFPVGEGVCGFVADTGAYCYLPDVRDPERTGPELAVLDGHGALLAVPMLHKGQVVGVMEFFQPASNAFDDDDVRLLQALAAQAAMAVVNAQLYEQTLELSITDPLTQLMNRRAMTRRLEIELIRAQRFGLPLSVLMIDVDHFKQYNDHMGHMLGDEALKAVARALDGSVRKVDAVARFGGEEFCVFLPRTDEHAGRDVAEKLRLAVTALELPGAKNQPLGHMSISVGLAVFPSDLPAAVAGPVTDALLDCADQAVYQAKSEGRDQVVSASEVHDRPKRPELDEPGGVGEKLSAADADPSQAGSADRSEEGSPPAA